MIEEAKKHSAIEYICLVFKTDKRLIFYLIYDVLLELFYTLAPIGMIGILTDVYTKDQTDEGFKTIIFVLLAFTFGKVLISIFNMIFRNEMYDRSYRFVQNKVTKNLYKKIQEIDFATYQSSEFLNIYQKAVDDATGYMWSTFWNFNSFVSSLVSLIGLGAILSFINPIILVYSVLVGVISYLISHKRATVNQVLSDKNMQNIRERGYVKRTFYLKDASIDVKTTDISSMYLDLNDNIGDRVINNIDKYMTKTNGLAAINIILIRSIYAIALAFVAYTAIGSSNVVIITSLVSASVSLSETISWLSDGVASLKENLVHRKEYYRVIDQTCKIEKSGTVNELEDFESIKFKNVSFKYTADAEHSLESVSLTINKNDKIAIVGENGAGKTTFIKLLLRLYDPNNGDIFYNDINYKDIKPSSLREKFITVFQNYQIYALSVAENILLRKIESKEDEELVIDALKKVGLYEKISRLEKGIHTICTKEFDKDGAEFSGGERQKLVIARIFASRSKILVLDEPNSALDPLAEKNIFEEIFKFANDKTLIFISHRFSTTINADKIYLFDEGKLKEEGTHKDLMSKDTEYKRMFNIQAEKYQSEVNK